MSGGATSYSDEAVVSQEEVSLSSSHAGERKGAQWLSGRVLDSRLRVAGSRLTGVTALCP